MTMGWERSASSFSFQSGVARFKVVSRQTERTGDMSQTMENFRTGIEDQATLVLHIGGEFLEGDFFR